MGRQKLESPNPVDIYVGQRIKNLRIMRGKSQSDLAKAMGLTFQQIQKYEIGTNRVSASKLFAAATYLEVPVGYFFDGASPDIQTEPLIEPDRRALTLIRHFMEASPAVQNSVLDILRAVKIGVTEAANEAGTSDDASLQRRKRSTNKAA